MTKRYLVSCVCSLLLLTHAAARAQAEPEEHADRVEYKQTIEAALEEYGLQHFEEARSLFERAHSLDPNARTLRGLGMVEFELRHYVRAAELLQAALASERKPLTPEQRGAVEELLARTRQFIALYNLDVRPAQVDLRVELDGRRVELPDSGSLTLEAGEHVLRVSAPDAQPRELRLDVKGGERQTLRIELEVHPQPRPGEHAAATPAQSARRRRAALGLMSSGGALLVGGGVVGVFALMKAKDTPLREGDAADRARHMAIAADVSLGVGAALALLGVVLRLTEPDAEPRLKVGGLREPQLEVRF